MVMENKALLCNLLVLINSQYPRNLLADKQLFNSENWTLKFLSNPKRS